MEICGYASDVGIFDREVVINPSAGNVESAFSGVYNDAVFERLIGAGAWLCKVVMPCSDQKLGSAKAGDWFPTTDAGGLHLACGSGSPVLLLTVLSGLWGLCAVARLQRWLVANLPKMSKNYL